MIVTINTLDKSIDWASSGIDRKVQNIKNLLNTFRYEVAYDRLMGLRGEFIDKPLDQGIVIAISEITEALMDYLPDVTILEVSFVDLSDEGDMNFKVVIDIE